MMRLWIVAVMIIVGIAFAGYAAWGEPGNRLELTLVAQQKISQEQEAQQQPKPPAEEIRDARQEAREGTPLPAVPQQEPTEVGTSESGSASATASGSASAMMSAPASTSISP
jgi:hypothetical protein